MNLWENRISSRVFRVEGNEEYFLNPWSKAELFQAGATRRFEMESAVHSTNCF